MPALFPMMSAPENFRPGDVVRKFVSDLNVSPYVGTVTHISPSTYKVWVQWPVAHEQESPETLIKINPLLGIPTATEDMGYDSYEKNVSERLYGSIPKRVMAEDKMAIRVAHTFAHDIIGRLIDDVASCQEEGLTDFQTYNRMYVKYSNTCSDHIMKYAVMKIFSEMEKNHENS